MAGKRPSYAQRVEMLEPFGRTSRGATGMSFISRS